MRFTGNIDKLTFNLGPSQISAEDDKTAAKAIAIAHDSDPCHGKSDCIKLTEGLPVPTGSLDHVMTPEWSAMRK